MNMSSAWIRWLSDTPGSIYSLDWRHGTSAIPFAQIPGNASGVLFHVLRHARSPTKDETLTWQGSKESRFRPSGRPSFEPGSGRVQLSASRLRYLIEECGHWGFTGRTLFGTFLATRKTLSVDWSNSSSEVIKDWWSPPLWVRQQFSSNVPPAWTRRLLNVTFLRHILCSGHSSCGCVCVCSRGVCVCVYVHWCHWSINHKS